MLLLSLSDNRLSKTINAIALLFIVSCTSSPEKSTEIKLPSKFRPQSYSSDLIYEDTKHSFKLKADIYILSLEAIRIDIRTQLDFPLVSLLMTENNLEVANYRDKKYFSGKQGVKGLDSVIPLDITAADLVAVVLERPQKSQRCETREGILATCIGQAGPTAYRVNWSKRDPSGPWYGRAKKMSIQIPHKKINLNFYFTDWQAQLSKTEGLTVLNIPADFQKVNK